MTGFETIGNATIVAYDDSPVLATDPWIAGSPYFGSWGLSYEIPNAQMEAIVRCPYVWFSHGHPDHLNAASLARLTGRTILLPDHVGGRIAAGLTRARLTVRVLPDRRWVELSPRVKVLSVADYNQDAALLIDVNGRLLLDLNDGNALGSERFIKRIVRHYRTSFLLRLFGYGDADMINYCAEDGKRILPAAHAKRPVGPIVQGYAEMYGVTHVIPFSCFHRYQRSDSIWANEYTTPPEAFAEGFSSPRVTLLPAFVRCDCERDAWEPIAPRSRAHAVVEPKEFGDDWSEQLSKDDGERLRTYFGRMEILRGRLDAVIFSVGGQDHTVDIARHRSERTRRAVTFAVPRHSLVKAVKHEIFDDLLIGNFMRTTLHGPWTKSYLYPHFAPLVPKYADNGRARTKEELREYFRAYRSRAPLEFLLHRLQQRTLQQFRSWVPPDSRVFYAGKKAYFQIKKVVG